jgi:hypothetical protein
MSDHSNKSTSVVLCRLWSKTSAKGTFYMAGCLGAARITILLNRDRKGDDDATHVAIVSTPQEREGGR